MQEIVNKYVSQGRNKVRSLRRTKELFRKFYYNNDYEGLYIYFITFTFEKEYNNMTYKNWNRRQFKDYLQRNELEFNLICNLDFGKVNQRFHLHGLISTREPLEGDILNKYGFTKYEPVYSENCLDYIIKYSNKFNYSYNFRCLRVNKIKIQELV